METPLSRVIGVTELTAEGAVTTEKSYRCPRFPEFPVSEFLLLQLRKKKGKDELQLCF